MTRPRQRTRPATRPDRPAQPSTRLRDAAKDETRRALIAAGLVEFAEHGLDLPSLDAICSRAGYTRGAFYVHFKNREAFLLALAERVLDAIVETALSMPAEGGLAGTIGHFSDALEAGIWPLEPKIRVATVRLIDATERWPAIRTAFDRFTLVPSSRIPLPLCFLAFTR